jgi:hypothetical protein
MTPTPLPQTDPLALVEHLDPKALLAEAAELTRRRDAVLVLLRAARARHRGRRPAPGTPPPTDAEVGRGE